MQEKRVRSPHAASTAQREGTRTSHVGPQASSGALAAAAAANGGRAGAPTLAAVPRARACSNAIDPCLHRVPAFRAMHTCMHACMQTPPLRRLPLPWPRAHLRRRLLCEEREGGREGGEGLHRGARERRRRTVRRSSHAATSEMWGAPPHSALSHTRSQCVDVGSTTCIPWSVGVACVAAVEQRTDPTHPGVARLPWRRHEAHGTPATVCWCCIHGFFPTVLFFFFRGRLTAIILTFFHSPHERARERKSTAIAVNKPTRSKQRRRTSLGQPVADRLSRRSSFKAVDADS